MKCQDHVEIAQLTLNKAFLIMLRHRAVAEERGPVQAIGHANALLEGMQFFEQCNALLAAGQHKAAIGVVLRFSAAASLLGVDFLR